MRGEDGQMILLAGVILVIAFVLTAVTLAEIRNLESDVALETRSRLADEFRSLRSLLVATLDDVTTPQTTNATFLRSFNGTAETFHLIERAKGYELHLELAGNASQLSPKTEWHHFTVAVPPPYFRNYTGNTYNASLELTGLVFDGKSDGIVWANGQIRAAIVYLHVADQAARMDEVIVIGLT